MGRISDKPILTVFMCDSVITPVGGVGTKWSTLLKKLTDYEIYVINAQEVFVIDTHNSTFICELIYNGYAHNYSNVFRTYESLVDNVILKSTAIIVIDFAMYHLLDKTIKEHRVPSILSLEAPIQFPQNMYINKMNSYIYAVNNFDIILSVASYDAYHCFKDFTVDKNKFQIVPNGIDIDYIETCEPLPLPGKNKYKLVYIGRLVPEKNINVLLDCTLPEDTDLIIFGTVMLMDDYYPVLLASKPNTYFLGQAPMHLIPRYIKSANAVIMPSATEPFGLVAVETLACEVPLIASYCDGMSTWLSPDAATNCGTTMETIQKVLSTFDYDSPDVQRKAGFGKEYVKRYSLNILVDKINTLIKSIGK